MIYDDGDGDVLDLYLGADVLVHCHDLGPCPSLCHGHDAFRRGLSSYLYLSSYLLFYPHSLSGASGVLCGSGSRGVLVDCLSFRPLVLEKPEVNLLLMV